MNRSLVSAFLVIAALLAAAGAGVWFENAGASEDTKPPPEAALRIARLVSLYHTTRIHFDMWETDPETSKLQQELVRGLRTEANLELTWKSRYYPTSLDHVSTTEKPRRNDPFEERAIAKLRRQKAPSREILSDDGTRYVRAIRLDKNCARCHKRTRTGELQGKEGQVMGFLSLDLSFDNGT